MSFASGAPGGPSRLRRQLKMDGPFEHSADEIKRLQRCNNDLVSVLALPAMWTGAEASQIVHTLLDALLGMLDLDLVYVRLKGPVGDAPLEMVRVAPSRKPFTRPQEIGEVLNRWLGDEPQKWPALARNSIGDEDISIVPLPLGLQGDIGVVVAGARRADFPRETERLLLSVAANQASIGLQEARLLSEQKRAANELDQRVAQRTAELAAANAELQLQVGLLQLLPVSAWTLKPDGTPDFVNQVWLEYSGQTVDFVRSYPEAWMSAVHPDDRETESRSFWEGVRSGQDFAFETRSLRARDGTYRWHLQQAVALRDAEGKVLKFVGTTTDIDDQKRAGEALRARELNLRLVIDTIPTLAWCNLPDGPNEFLNKRWHAYTGLSPEESHGWGWQVAFHPEDLPPLMKTWQQLLISGDSGEIEARLRRHDGVYRWFLIRVEPLRDEEGKIVRWYGTSTDIDDRKLAEEKLQASETNLRQILDSIPGQVYALNPAGQVELPNRQLLEYFGKTLDELKAWRTNDAVHPDDLPRVIADFTHAMTTGVPFENELRYRRADGVYRWFQARAHPVRDAAGRIARWYSLITDIDDRKRAEEKLRLEEKELKQSEARKTAILESALDCILTIDHEGCITEFNPAAEHAFGYRRDEVLGMPLANVIIPLSLREKHRQSFAHYLATGEARVLGKRIETTAVRADGSEFPVELAISRIPLEGPPSFTGYLRDITERKRAEQELRRSEAFLAEAQHLSRIGSFSWRVATDEITFSEQLYRIFQINRDAPVTFEVIGTRIHPEDLSVFREHIERCRQDRSDVQIELRLQMPDGAVKYVHVVAHIRGGHEYIGAVQDVTERRASEEALSKARSDLAHVSRVTSLGAMTASIAHEVNQPLSGIVTNASTCLRMLAADPPNVDGARETARRTIRDGNRMSEVIIRLRALFSKKEPTTESVNLNDAVLEVIALTIVDLQKNRVMLRPELADDLPLVRGDRVQLQQVILNLLRNGSDAMSAVEDRARQLVIRTERDEGDRVRLTVQDTGVGFDPQTVDRIFDPFYTTKGEGMGIGLSVSRSIIENHHGRLWATLNEGPGATFSFSIPHVPENLIRADGVGSIQAA
ncbi:MAG: PAS domain S-box protein [Terriglobales bacterium]